MNATDISVSVVSDLNPIRSIKFEAGSLAISPVGYRSEEQV
jgi:hypothetical protein